MIRLGLDGGRILYHMSKDTAQVVAAMKEFLEKKILESKTLKGGQKKLTDLLRTTSDLQIVTLDAKDRNFFEKMARHYGVKYHISKSDVKGRIDCLFPAQDIKRVNHVLEKMRIPVAKPLRSHIKDRLKKVQHKEKNKEQVR